MAERSILFRLLKLAIPDTQTLSIRNVNKRIKRRDVKLAQSQAQVKEMERQQKAQDKTIKKLETRLQCAQSSVHCLRQRIY